MPVSFPIPFTIEDFDSEVIRPLAQAMEAIESIKMMVVVSHESSVMSMKYERSPVPYLVYPSTPGSTGQYDEQLLETGKVFKNAPDLLTAFLTNQL